MQRVQVIDGFNWDYSTIVIDHVCFVKDLYVFNRQQLTLVINDMC